jgi:hypothetical protein
LGPFLGKSFATSISPWVITPEALAPAATGQVPRVHQLLPYLSPSTDKPMFDIKLSVSLRGIIFLRLSNATRYIWDDNSAGNVELQVFVLLFPTDVCESNE